MNEKEWVEIIKEFLSSMNLGKNIKISTLQKLPYANEITQYIKDFKKPQYKAMNFETDLLIYEKANDTIVPRIVIEAKFGKISTHDAITYSYKAQNHRNVTPFLRYGIMLGNSKNPLPGRLFRHGSNFDFMISFKNEELSDIEKKELIKLITSEIEYSKQIEEMIYESRSFNRKHYFVMQKALYLKETPKVC